MKLTKEVSPFQVDVVVAVVQTHRWTGERSFRRGVVGKVHKTGKFILKGDADCLWKPEISFGKPTAYANGMGRSHIVLWSEEVEAEIELNKEKAETERKRSDIHAAIGVRHNDCSVRPDRIRTMHAIMKLDAEDEEQKLALINYILKSVTDDECAVILDMTKRHIQLLGKEAE